MLRAVIFDFDGVITDSEILHLRAFNQVLARHNIKITQKDYYQNYLGLTDLDFFYSVAEKQLGLDAGQIINLLERKKQAYEKLARTDGQIIEGVRASLEMLRQNDIPMAICSGALLTEIELMLEEAGLRDFFAEIISAEQVRKGKPHPDGFLLTLQRLNHGRQVPIAGSQCVVIEDSRWGLQAAAAAGMHTVAVTNSYDAEQLSMGEKIVTQLDELSMDDLQKLCV